eukprot:TRINITY_DN31568_c0_g1_i1.p1 TRINITY_DN31568_c0_g1~~TRINITY_DN31568_c0_g1_i1.p1  ORF type:complete len:229 (+),score=51.84 TRINITY_DN31568_c0_g1_i1:234-920(+)
MLPLSGGLNTPELAGPLTPEMEAKMRQIRCCVMGVFVSAVGRLCTGDFPVGDMLCCVNGVFLLREDVVFVACYNCLRSGPLENCAGPSGGGLSCLGPFAFLAGFNCVMLSFRLLMGGPFLVLSFVCQSLGAAFAWRLQQLVTAEHLLRGGSLEEGAGAGGQAGLLNSPFSQMRMMQPPGANAPSGGAPNGGAAPNGGGNAGGGGGGRAGGPSAPGFTAFHGTGQRLGG